MRRRDTAKIAAIEASMLILCFTLQGVMAKDSGRKCEAATPYTTQIEAEYVTETVVGSVEDTTETAEPETEETESVFASMDWGADDAEILAKIAMAEVEGEGTTGKALVILVVLNRVWSDEFPDSIEAVVFQDGQFSTVSDGGRYWTTEPDEDCYIALAMVENGWDESQGALYFESCNHDSWHSRNLEFLFQEGNHRFYR